MAKKSNKTEHVLKLITKDEETIESFIEEESTPESFIEKAGDIPEVEISVKPSEGKELTYETKLKIEIEPKVEIKSKEQPEEVVIVKAAQHVDGSAFIERHGHLINLAETLAAEKIQMVMERMNVCNCSICFNDVMALALNTLPTKYVTTDSGKQYFQLDIYKKQYETDVLAALTKACVRVKAASRHQ